MGEVRGPDPADETALCLLCQREVAPDDLVMCSECGAFVCPECTTLFLAHDGTLLCCCSDCTARLKEEEDVQ